MKNYFTIIISAVFIVCFTWHFALAEKNAPVDKVDKVLESMGELEESYEKDDWGEALEAAINIDKELKEIIAHVQTDDLNVQGALDNLKTSIEEKNKEETELAYIVFQRRFFSLLNEFNYEIHPVLTILEQYIIEEAGEAAEKNDIEEVLSEMRESGNLFKYAKPILQEKGVSQEALSEFNAKIIALIKAGNSNNPQQVQTLLKEIQQQYKVFMAAVK